MIALPQQVADEAKLLDEVDVEVQSGGLRIAPVRAPKVTLEELVAGITDENRHEETEWGARS